jgi:hypothetical protein
VWWFSNNSAFQAYDSLENGSKAVFSHEFFHMVQWNILLSTGRPHNHWLNVFIEAQGRFAPSVQYPEMEMRKEHLVWKESEFGSAANRFLTQRLNSSYRDLDTASAHKYDAALYWRFLYEQFNGMGIIRAALEEMARHYNPDIVGSLGAAMNGAFSRFDGPFHTYEESLIAFARANYALRLENGRCLAADPTGCVGYHYDPNGLYADPLLEAQLDYDKPTLTHAGSIPASFGMDFVEIRLDRSLHNKPVIITLQGQGAWFNVQMWKLGPGGSKPRAVTPRPETMAQQNADTQFLSIPHLDTAAYDRLALIITRLDTDEAVNPVGSYRITLAYAEDVDDGTLTEVEKH